MQDVNWARLFPTADPQARALLTKLLSPMPDERTTAEQALTDPWFSRPYDPQLEPSAPGMRQREGQARYSHAFCICTRVSRWTWARPEGKGTVT